jgi:hypothetical protein
MFDHMGCQGCRFFTASASGVVTLFPVILKKKGHCFVKSISARKTGVIKVTYTTANVDVRLLVYTNNYAQFQSLAKNYLIYVLLTTYAAKNICNNEGTLRHFLHAYQSWFTVCQ